MKSLNTILTTLLLLVVVAGTNAQIKFKLNYDESTQRYTVSVVPQTTYLRPENITGTGQVTIKVPSNQFDPVDIVNHAKGMIWEANSRNNSPIESPGSDYISFGLIIQGIAFPEYLQFTDLPIFSFRNAFGCTGKISLVDNLNDPFFPPNSLNANIGNTLTIMGARGDAYIGITGPSICDCSGSLTNTGEDQKVQSHKLFPNPASDVINAEIIWQGEKKDVVMQLVDGIGKKIESRNLSVWDGANIQKFEISSLPPATYWIYVRGDNLNISLGKFTKQ